MNSTPYHVLDADVIIIGAGIAGMTSAYTLLEKEPALQVLILEASDKVGGRTASKFLTVRNNESVEFDFGGQWICLTEKPVFELIAKLGLKVNKQTSKNNEIVINYEGKLSKISKEDPLYFTSVAAQLELASFVKKIETLCLQESLDPELAALSMESFIKQNISKQVNKTILETVLLFHLGVTSASITVGFYIFFCITTHGINNQLKMGNKRQYWIQGGAHIICEKLVELLGDNVILMTKTRALEVKVHDHTVEINSTDGTFYSNDVIIAIPPPNILQIKFTPPLIESKVAALNNSTPGIQSKFVATYTFPFWEKANCNGEVYVFSANCIPSPILYCYDNSREDKPALGGLSIGTVSEKEVLESLAYHFGDEALQPLDFVIYNWASGAPTCSYKFYKDVEDIRLNVDRIFWAGSETSMEWYGTICGAIISGNVAARDVLYDLRPAVLDVEDMMLIDHHNLSYLQRHEESRSNFYQKAINPYYQVMAVILGVFFCIIGRKSGLFGRVKRLLIKQ